MARLGELERAVMDVLWADGGWLTAREVAGRLPGDRQLAYTTVLTVLDRLGGKDFVRRERAGRAYRYRAAAGQEDFVAEAMVQALDTSADRRSALMRFLGSVSEDDARLLREIVGRER